MPEGSITPFLLFGALILTLLALDLFVFQRRSHSMKLREAIGWSTFWVSLGLCFNVYIYFMYENHWLGVGIGESYATGGAEAALQFFTGYLIELALSVDNIFVFIVLFTYFAVPQKFHHKILFWGILGAIVMRLVFIVTGSILISRFEWILYIFGLILVVSGWKMMRHDDTEVHPEKNIFIRIAKKFFPVATGFDSPDFFVRINGTLHMTSMFLVLITVETTDVVFAVDSIPAVFAVTRDPFIVFSSNIFAILGLRSLYFVLASVINTFHYLKIGLSVVLMFVGLKMIIHDFFPVPILISLLVVAGVLFTSIIASVIRLRRLPQTKGTSQ